MNFLDLDGLKSYHTKLVSLIKSLAGGVTSFNTRTGDVTPQDGDYNAYMVGAVPDTRTVNGKRLNTDITITKDDIEGLSDLTAPDLSGYVPTSRTVNGKALSSDISLSASDVSALPLTGGNLTGDLRIKGSGNSGTKINLGDGDYVHISEPEAKDDCLEIKAKMVDFVLSDTTDSKFTINGANPFSSSGASVGQSMAGQSVKPTANTTVTAQDFSEIFNDYASRTYNSSDIPISGNVASGSYSHAEGRITTASSSSAHAEGDYTIARGAASHAEGSFTLASEADAHAEGSNTVASGLYSHAEGYQTTASDKGSHAEGCRATASGAYSHASGCGTIASALYQTVIGEYNVENSTYRDYFIIGKGSDGSSRSTCFRVTNTGVYTSGSYHASGADYAEFFEWLDGNAHEEDRTGLFVTLDGKYIKLANSEDDFILGITSGNPSIVGDVHDDQWQGMYLYDIYGRPIFEDVEVPDETVEEPDLENPEKTITRVLIPAHTEHRQKLNPEYDNTQTYIPRSKRKEWACVGMMGKLVVQDDGTCEVNGYAKVGKNGKATKSETKTKYRIMYRIDESHISILVLA